MVAIKTLYTLPVWVLKLYIHPASSSETLYTLTLFEQKLHIH